MDKDTHYNQELRREARFITPPNHLKAKVGSGGLSDEILGKAEALLENNSADFGPLADMYLGRLMQGVEDARKGEDPDSENLIAGMLYPVMQLKANGGMFQYQLVTALADKLIQFLEVIEKPDIEAIEIVLATHTSIKAIVSGQIKGDGGKYGADLQKALSDACYRYFEKYPENVALEEN